MVKGIGVDVLEIERFKKFSSDQDFIKQFLNENEISTVLTTNRSNYLQVAKIFAIKEALLKAFGTGLYYGYFWHNIEISAKWEVNLSGYLKDVYERLDVKKINISLGHTKNTLTAIVILE